VVFQFQPPIEAACVFFRKTLFCNCRSIAVLINYINQKEEQNHLLLEPKGFIMIRKTIMLIGLLFIAVHGAQFVSANIIKGNSWVYHEQNQTGFPGSVKSEEGTITISIDSVWGIEPDTVFFRVSETDSLHRLPDDSIIKNMVKIDAKKISGSVICSSGLVQKMFGSCELTQYDSADSRAEFPVISRNFCYIIKMTFNGDTLNAIRKGHYRNTNGATMPTIIRGDSTTFLDTIGLAYFQSFFHPVYAYQPFDSSLTLLKYCGKDFNYTTLTGIKNKYTNVNKTSPSNRVAYHKVLGRNTGAQGYTLLGRKGNWKESSFEVLIQKK
jgi:hypothetical protein